MTRAFLLAVLLSACGAVPAPAASEEDCPRVPTVMLAEGYTHFTCSWTWLADDHGSVPFLVSLDDCTAEWMGTLEETGAEGNAP